MAIRGVAGVTAFMVVSLWLYVEDGWYEDVLLVFAGLALPVAVGCRFGMVAVGAYVVCVAATFVVDFGVQAWSGSDSFYRIVWVWLVLPSDGEREPTNPVSAEPSPPQRDQQ